jgi:aryl-alcohol dehydrogenase-like predicted oxidoreductase
VTRLGLGTAPLSGLYAPVAHEDALRTIDAAWHAGIRFFDTAPLYGHGLAETRLGEALANRPRDSYVLATKVGRLLRPVKGNALEDRHYKGTPPVAPLFDFSYDGVMRSVEESLVRLKLDRIDVLHIHDPDDHYDDALAGAYPALAQLRQEGVVGAIGAGMNQWEMLQGFAVQGNSTAFCSPVATRCSIARPKRACFRCASGSRSRSSRAASTTAASSPIARRRKVQLRSGILSSDRRSAAAGRDLQRGTACRSRPRRSSFRSRMRR